MLRALLGGAGRTKPLGAACSLVACPQRAQPTLVRGLTVASCSPRARLWWACVRQRQEVEARSLPSPFAGPGSVCIPPLVIIPPACLQRTHLPKPSWVMNTVHLQGGYAGHTMYPDKHPARSLRWGFGDVTYPSLHHAAQAQSAPCQAHLYHIRSLPLYLSLQVKLSKLPVPQENCRRLWNARLTLPGQTQPARDSQEGRPR